MKSQEKRTTYEKKIPFHPLEGHLPVPSFSLREKRAPLHVKQAPPDPIIMDTRSLAHEIPVKHRHNRKQLTLNILFSCLLLGAAVLGALSLSRSHWITADAESAALLGYETIELGVFTECTQLLGDSDVTCGTYGSSLKDIPYKEWQVVAVLLMVTSFLSFVSFVLSVVAVSFDWKAHSYAVYIIGVSSLLYTGAAITFGYSLHKLSQNPSTPRAPCRNGGVFNSGSCTFDWGSILAMTGCAVSTVASLLAFCLRDPLELVSSSQLFLV
eukprot:m.138464 g.138464  ORF g.138464 m.138464 type:complete len:269 (-) comp20267_c0_seq6:107-913(-)